jgi:SAM-dependent methyltransferase
MEREIIAKLLQLNAEFYQTFAAQFSDTRRRIQPGVRRILDSLNPGIQLLDLGCGNGELARELLRRGFTGQYTGLDFSDALLKVAREGVSGARNYHFIQGNLVAEDWQHSLTSAPNPITQSSPTVQGRNSTDFSEQSCIPAKSTPYDIVFAFASLHHIPGRGTHLRIMRTIRNLLAVNGHFVHSNWQFLNSQRLRKRIHPWAEIGLSDEDVDPNDYLLDWRRGGFGLRYVHHFSEEELFTLAEESGFQVVSSSRSDGETGDLSLYQVWQAIR